MLRLAASLAYGISVSLGEAIPASTTGTIGQLLKAVRRSFGRSQFLSVK